MATTAKFWSKLSAASAHKTLPRVVSSGQGAYLTIGGKNYLNFCSSHYLGFAEEPRLKKAAKDAIDLYGLGTGYRTLAGTHALHIALEEKIAHFKGTEAAVTFSSAYAANASARPSPILSPMHPVHTRRDRVASLPPCRVYGAATQRASPLGPGRALTLPCGWNNAGRGD